MAISPSITRRAAVIGALFSSLPIGVPAVAAVRPTDDVAETIKKWRAADAVYQAAYAEYDAWCSTTPPWMRGNECPAHGRFLEAQFTMQDALSDMLRALRRT